MPADLSLLRQPFRADYGNLLKDCASAGFTMRCFFTLRDPWIQARLWRQSRSGEEVRLGVAMLLEAGAPWLAKVLDGVGPSWGVWATNAVPGNSWHQWGEAGDAVAFVDGVQSWDTIRGDRGGPGDSFYRHYSELADRRGMRSLASAGDWVHVQARKESSPRRLFSWPDIDVQMRKQFRAVV